MATSSPSSSVDSVDNDDLVVLSIPPMMPVPKKAGSALLGAAADRPAITYSRRAEAASSKYFRSPPVLATRKEQNAQEVEDKRKAEARTAAALAAAKEESARKRARQAQVDAYRKCRSAAEKLVKDHLADKRDPAHDWGHVNRVRTMALRIADTLPKNTDIKVFELVALFHGLVDRKQNTVSRLCWTATDKSAKNPSATDLITILIPFFNLEATTIGLTASQIGLIIALAPSVSRRLNPPTWSANCPELLAVRDAEALDRLGPIGLMRAVAMSAGTGQLLVDDGSELGRKSVEAHFKRESVEINEGMKTAFGKTEAAERCRIFNYKPTV